ncbi:MAG: SPFH domain-containing protein [Singulisphaera sp.]
MLPLMGLGGMPLFGQAVAHSGQSGRSTPWSWLRSGEPCWSCSRGVRYIPNNRVGIVEKLWSARGSVPVGQIMALVGEAGMQADLLRGGLHFGLWVWQYRIHKVGLVTVPQGKIGYVYSRDGEPLMPSQTIGHVVDCNNFQDAHAFLLGDARVEGREPHVGQRGRQRAMLREGVYAINTALFVVITEEAVYRLEFQGKRELEALVGWQNELKEIGGFDPVVIGGTIAMLDPLNPDHQILVDTIGIVTVHDGPSLPPGEIIAPAVGSERSDKYFHNNYQDPEAFLRAGGHRGRQYVPLTDGTYFINRWFATVEPFPKTVVPIGYVGVIVSYYGRIGQDVSGVSFRHGERVAEGERGVLERPLGPGKYAFNTYAGNIVLVPTTNFVLHWVTGKSEGHRYDESLRSVDLVTHDAYEPMLPLSVVVHIDYLKAPNVIQRFGDVKKLITQTLDPMLSAYFRDVAHKQTMLQLLQERDDIQRKALAELRGRFHEFDIECVDVLIGKPDTAEAGGKIETLLEQLRIRQLSIEQIVTYEHQRAAAEKLQTLNDAQAAAEAKLTASRVQVESPRTMARPPGPAPAGRQMVVTAEAESQQRHVPGRGSPPPGRPLGSVGLARGSSRTPIASSPWPWSPRTWPRAPAARTLGVFRRGHRRTATPARPVKDARHADQPPGGRESGFETADHSAGSRPGIRRSNDARGHGNDAGIDGGQAVSLRRQPLRRPAFRPRPRPRSPRHADGGRRPRPSRRGPGGWPPRRHRSRPPSRRSSSQETEPAPTPPRRRPSAPHQPPRRSDGGTA